jgi:hypothetical protein
MQLGAAQSTYFFDGDMAFVGCWNRILGLHEIHRLVRGLGCKYNLTPFGFGHADAGRLANGDLRYLTLSPVCLADDEILDMT